MASSASPSPHILYADPSPKKWLGDPNLSLAGTGYSVPRGIESVLCYNELILNDLTVYDKYRVLSIEGLSDPDIRDSREDNPGDDGETTYGTYYGGRTIVIKIRIEAYQLDKLRDMEESLRTAVSDVSEEKPLYFLTGDPEKDHYINCKKSASLSKDEDISSIDYRHFREWQITLRASDPRFYRLKGKIESVDANANRQLSAVNVGNYNCYPIIKIGGLMTNIELVNNNAPEPFNNIKFKSFSLNSNNYYTIDTYNRTITDQNGNNMINKLDPTSGWLKIYPGTNIIYLSESTIVSSSTAMFSVTWKDSWI